MSSQSKAPAILPPNKAGNIGITENGGASKKPLLPRQRSKYYITGCEFVALGIQNEKRMRRTMFLFLASPAVP